MSDNQIIKLAILAVGGQGGGVLSNWIVDVAERSGYAVQSTSVAGVAQRTGATIYYIEIAAKMNGQPVFSLSPAEGDVDILIAAELMEAGRAVTRGFVTQDQTTLITSTHRILAVSEKLVPGEGRVSSEEVYELARAAAKQFISFDMEQVARKAGTVISSTLLGALASSNCLPFPKQAYEAAIRDSGRGVAASLKGFQSAFEIAADGDQVSPFVEATVSKKVAANVRGPKKQLENWEKLQKRVRALPVQVQDFAKLGLVKTVDYQDINYGHEYLDQLERAIRADGSEREYVFSNAAAKHLANAFCYNDVIHVAELKCRSSRFGRVRTELALKENTVLRLTEYFHPRAKEFCGILPRRFGQFIEDRPKLSTAIDKLVNRGQRIKTSSIFGYTSLWLVAGLRNWRRGNLRHHVEMQHISKWLDLALNHIKQDYQLSVEVLNCRRLIKGYSDTHVRGHSKFDRVLSGLDLISGRKDAADWISRLSQAALKDENGELLDGMLKTIATMSD